MEKIYSCNQPEVPAPGVFVNEYKQGRCEMFDIMSWIIPPVSGAVIGYFTNWLAIKMLFRPHTEQRIFGIRLPFTPGLIPKERLALAKKIGSALSEHVITKDAFADAILSEKIMSGIERVIDNAVDSALRGDRQIRAWLSTFPHSAVDNSVDNVDNLNSDGLLRLVYNNAVQFICGNILENTEPISAFFSKDVLETLKGVVREKIPSMAHGLLAMTFENPLNDMKLNQLLKRVLDESLGAITGLFVNKDKLYASIKKNITTYLDDDENLAALGERACGLIDEALARPMSEYAGAADIPAFFEKNMRPLLESGMGKILDMTPGELLDRVLKERSESFVKFLKEYLFRLARGTARAGAEFLAANVNLGELVEERINAFEMDKAESILLSVVNRELNAITLLGGLLGFIIGLATMLIK
jgi:uncharacterized membrane protein YheB (UPF0754 family)